MGKRISDKRMIAALEKSGGLVYRAAKLLGCSPTAIYKRRDNNPVIRAVIETHRGLLVDEAEESIRKLVGENNPQATIYVLKTLGKRRGWSESPEKLELPFDLEEMVEVCNLLILAGMDMTDFMAQARALAESRLAQMGKSLPPRVEVVLERDGDDDDA